MKTEFDVIVVGAGINGIAAGAYLQKAGLDVAVVEREPECGPFCRSDDIFGNGLPVDTCAVMLHVAYGPAWKDLEL
ncbi:MAG: FAD-dependent oxidoreductase, partial [Syntrophales bacterium]|nr:FAD-dependent oxidoreductase [Syntrophales bacterium]